MGNCVFPDWRALVSLRSKCWWWRGCNRSFSNYDDLDFADRPFVVADRTFDTMGSAYSYCISAKLFPMGFFTENHGGNPFAEIKVQIVTIIGNCV